MPSPARPGLGWPAILGIALGLLLSIALIGASARLATRNAETLHQVGRVQETRSLLASMLSAMESAETGQRGFLLTEKASYLDPYRRGSLEAPALLDRLEQALRETSGERWMVEVAGLRQLASGKLDEMARTVALARSGDRAGSLDMVQSDLGQSYMRGIRRIVRQIDSAQQQHLVEGIALVNRDGRLLVAADAVGLILLATLAGGIGWGGWQAFQTLRAAQQEIGGAYQALEIANETLEQRVNERTAALTEANEEIQRFAYIVSHDLRAPLVNIMGFTSEMESAAAIVDRFVGQAAERDPAGTAEVLLAAREDIPESIRFIKTSTAKMDRLIGAILKLSREGRRVLSPERIDMAGMIRGIAASMQHQADERGARFEAQAMPDATTDRLVMEQVFSNLMENALKYLKPGRPGRIVVSGRVAGPVVVYEVADNGRGIAARDLERVFELFRRAGDQSVPGEGIGLAHVRALVRRLGGRIDCVSEIDVGSKFRVELPRGEMPQAMESRGEDAQEQERAGP